MTYDDLEPRSVESSPGGAHCANVSPEAVYRDYRNHLHFDLAVDRFSATAYDEFLALSWAVRDQLVDRWIRTQNEFYETRTKRVYYISLEFLIGRSLGNNVLNLGMMDAVKQAMTAADLDLEDLREREIDAGLGNGGLGRLAACFLESMATLGVPAIGYSLRYEHGIFKQSIRNGFQVEHPDSWLRSGNPWEIARPERRVEVRFGGEVRSHYENGRYTVVWNPEETVWGVPYDMPVVGYGGRVVDTLRLWKSASPDDFDFDDFSRGDYFRAVDKKVNAENITKVLYPNDDTMMGKELRFRQQYFLVACSLHDIMRRFRKTSDNIRDLPDLVAIQLNDTHPTMAIPELMRMLVDEERVDWDLAWDLTVRTFAYTNHTLLSEALEIWPADMVERLLPRHYQIICEINHRFLKQVAAFFPGDTVRREKMSIIRENPYRALRMANLAIVGSHSVNGVAKLHSELIKTRLVPDFNAMFPERFNNKTNGVTPRRWLLKANPPLAGLITDAIGDSWISHLDDLRALTPLAEDSEFQERFRKTKRAAKQRLIEHCLRYYNIPLNPDTRFDVQCKRIHTYKRQLLNALHIVSLYYRLHKGTLKDFTPTTFIFSGKAAPGFALAKAIIKMINNIADIVNQDPISRDIINVRFLPNYRVSLAERLIPAADVSEQISVAGTEASGTGNMKFMMNGALTLGTMDGANIEIVEEVGADNAFIFGLSIEEVEKTRGFYRPGWHYENEPLVKSVLDMLFTDDVFCPGEREVFDPIRRFLFDDGDPYMHLADFTSYANAHQRVQQTYADRAEWSRKAILNIAASGYFSSDRTISEYARDIWNVPLGDSPYNGGGTKESSQAE
jgi:starch phosphorylase